ncbi:hypothetical protein NFJ02_05g122250 [Pycnococcus provasolii]
MNVRYSHFWSRQNMYCTSQYASTSPPPPPVPSSSHIKHLKLQSSFSPKQIKDIIMASRQQEQQHNNNNAASQESHNHGSLCLSLMLSHPACLAAAGCDAKRVAAAMATCREARDAARAAHDVQRRAMEARVHNHGTIRSLQIRASHIGDHPKAYSSVGGIRRISWSRARWWRSCQWMRRRDACSSQ